MTFFRGVISRDKGAPWGTTGLNSRTWLEVPVHDVVIACLVFTQPGVFLRCLLDATCEPFGSDPFPHVVDWQGSLYLEDGHHRAMRALLAGQRVLQARVLPILSQPEAAN